MALSDVRLRALKPRNKAYKVPDADGLYLEVRTSGAKLWRFRFCHLGKDSRISLGSYPEIGLASARRKRDVARPQLAAGLDPEAERRRAKLNAALKAANNFGDIEIGIESGRERDDEY